MNVEQLKRLRFTIFAATELAAQRFNLSSAKRRERIYACFYSPESCRTCSVEGVTSVCLPALNFLAQLDDDAIVLQMADYLPFATDFVEGVTDVYAYAVEERVLRLAVALLREPSDEIIATIGRMLRQNELVVIEDGRLLP
jgi:hypothetical protein